MDRWAFLLGAFICVSNAIFLLINNLHFLMIGFITTIYQFIAMGRNKLYRFSNGRWIFNSEGNFELPKSTLLYGEVVSEYFGKMPNQKVAPALHIIDGLILGGKDIRHLHFTERFVCTHYIILCTICNPILKLPICFYPGINGVSSLREQ